MRSADTLTNRTTLTALLVPAILLTAVLVYVGYDDHELLNWDDRTYVSNNPWVTNPGWSNVVATFTGIRAGNWHPLTWLSFVPEYALCGDRAACYKLTNSVLHGLNSLLVALLTLQCLSLFSVRVAGNREREETLCRRLAAALAGFLFAVHPQHVESVIWVAERKDLLCGLFYFASLSAYLRARSVGGRGAGGLAFTAFVLAVLSKSMAVTLPAVLVLFDLALAWQRRQLPGAAQLLRLAVLDKWHYWLVTGATILLTLNSQAVANIDQPGVIETLALCLAAVQHYLLTFIFPWNLAPFYPEQIVPQTPLAYWPLLVLTMVAVLMAWRANPAQRVLLALVLGGFLVALLPVIGLVKVGEQAYADRYTYIPMLGFYIGAAALIVRLGARRGLYRMAVAVLVVAALVGLAWETNRYKEVWRNDLVFWQTIVERFPAVAPTPWVNLGNSQYSAGLPRDAAASYRQALELDSAAVMAWINLATAYQALGEPEQALAVYSEGVDRNPGLAGLKSRAGRAFLAAGDLEQARAYLESAISLRPDLPEAQLGMGELLLREGRVTDAIEILEQVPASMPQFLPANLLLVQALALTEPEQARARLGQLRNTYGDIPAIVELSARLSR